MDKTGVYIHRRACGQGHSHNDTRILELETEVARLRGELEGERAVLAMTVARLGGEVEGKPTARVNFLQRIDELRKTASCRKIQAGLLAEAWKECARLRELERGLRKRERVILRAGEISLRHMEAMGHISDLMEDRNDRERELTKKRLAITEELRTALAQAEQHVCPTDLGVTANCLECGTSHPNELSCPDPTHAEPTLEALADEALEALGARKGEPIGPWADGLARDMVKCGKDDSTQAGPAPAEPSAEEMTDAWQEMRDVILHGLEGLDNDQTNEVLAVIDQYDPTSRAAMKEEKS